MDLDKTIETLNDTSKSWVDRRDAADALRDVALSAIRGLQGQVTASDTDVRLAVERNLEALNAPADAAPPTSANDEPRSLKDLVMACAKPGRREVSEDGDDFKVQVTLKNGRSQTVYVTRFLRKDGIKLIRVYSYCGEPDDDAYIWSLRANGKLVQSAVALMKRDDAEQLVLTRTFLQGEMTKPELHTAIKEIAHYSDWLEHKLTGKDDF